MNSTKGVWQGCPPQFLLFHSVDKFPNVPFYLSDPIIYQTVIFQPDACKSDKNESASLTQQYTVQILE